MLGLVAFHLVPEAVVAHARGVAVGDFELRGDETPVDLFLVSVATLWHRRGTHAFKVKLLDDCVKELGCWAVDGHGLAPPNNDGSRVLCGRGGILDRRHWE